MALAKPWASVVVLNSAVTRLAGDDTLLGLETHWLVGPSGKALDGPEFSHTTYTPGYRRLQPYSPVHLRATQGPDDDAVMISWIRRDRINGDDWAALEIPMNEASEAYEVAITSNLPGDLTISVSNTSLIVSSDELEQAFGALPDDLTIAVSQISATVGAGPAARIQLTM